MSNTDPMRAASPVSQTPPPPPDGYNEDYHRAMAPPLPEGGLVPPGEPLMDRDWFFWSVLIVALVVFGLVGEWLYRAL